MDTLPKILICRALTVYCSSSSFLCVSFATSEFSLHISYGTLIGVETTSFARAVENVPRFDQPNIHENLHFGIGGALRTIGNAVYSPGGM